jgi:hypothetical protein
MPYEYRADYGFRRDGSQVYVAVFRKDPMCPVPEEWWQGDWRVTPAAKEAFRDEGEVGPDLLNEPERITAEEAEAIVMGWGQSFKI